MDNRLKEIILLIDGLWVTIKNLSGEQKANEVTCQLYKWISQEILDYKEIKN